MIPTIKDLRDISKTQYLPITESFSLKDLFKFGKKDDKEIVYPDPKIVSTNFKEAYDGWYLSWMIKKDDIDDMNKAIIKTCMKHFKRPPNGIMIVPCNDFVREYNLTKTKNNFPSDECYVIMNTDIIPSRMLADAKQAWGARYFTDVVDNAVRIEMYDHPNYKPKPYIDMDNIAAAQKYLDNQAGK